MQNNLAAEKSVPHSLVHLSCTRACLCGGPNYLILSSAYCDRLCICTVAAICTQWTSRGITPGLNVLIWHTFWLVPSKDAVILCADGIAHPKWMKRRETKRGNDSKCKHVYFIFYCLKIWAAHVCAHVRYITRKPTHKLTEIWLFLQQTVSCYYRKKASQNSVLIVSRSLPLNFSLTGIWPSFSFLWFFIYCRRNE